MPLIDVECVACKYKDEIIVTSIERFDADTDESSDCPKCGSQIVRATAVHKLHSHKPGMNNLPFTVKI